MKRRRRTSSVRGAELLLGLLLFIFPICCFSDVDRIGREGDAAALLQVEREITADSAGIFSRWTKSSGEEEPCSWPGVSCDGGGRIVTVNISGKGDLGAPATRLVGRLSAAIGRLTELRVLSLPFHLFQGEVPAEIWELRSLEVVDLEGSSISGTLPSRFPRSLRVLNLAHNQIIGKIPQSISRCLDLEALNLSHNRIDGPIPNFPGDLPKLKVLDLSFNKISGRIPPEIGDRCSGLEHLDISGNLVAHGIPASLGNCKSLRALLLSSNLLSGALPAELRRLEQLQIMNVSHNSLASSLPAGLGDCSGSVTSLCRSLRYIDLSQNQIGGRIPDDLGLLSSLVGLDLSWNELHGQIPDSFGGLKNAEHILLAGNKLTGEIPSGLLHLRSLKSLDLSSNPLSGKRYSLLESSEPSPPSRSKFTPIEIAAVASAATVLAVLLAVIGIYVYTRKCLPRSTVQSSETREVTLFMELQVPLTYDTVVRATGNFTGSNCIGNGGFGATYKAEVAPGVIFAIKKITIGKVQAIQHFHAEIRALSSRRHRNLVTLIGYHLSEAQTFLIYNYLPGGNLEKFIRERSKRPVDFWVLHKIALDVGRALKYLHHRTVRIIHRDVKPSNILLDNEVNAYLSDFGLAKLLSTSETHLTTGVEGTFGYVAPEYATQGRVSDKADVYSYGVLLLELISDKRVLDPFFSDYGHGFNLVSWARMLMQQGREKEFFAPEIWEVGPRDGLVETLTLASTCTDALPSARPTMKVVVQRLKQLRSPPVV